MVRVVKLFVGLDFNQTTKAKIQHINDMLESVVKDGYKVMKNNLHMTLRYIGEVTEQKHQVISEALKTHLMDVEGFKLKDSGLGTFVHQDKHTVWLGVQKSDALISLYDTVSKALNSVGVAEEHRGFHPHVTLRKKAALTEELSAIKTESFEVYVKRVTLFKSHWVLKALVYTPIETFVLC